jgi:hypothetical protein
VQYESANKVVLIKVPELLTGNFVIPTSVRFIHSGAFLVCDRLTSVTFEGVPPSVGLLASDLPYPMGYYLPEHAAAWEAEMDEDGRWHGLKMEQR